MLIRFCSLFTVMAFQATVEREYGSRNGSMADDGSSPF